MIEKGVSHIAYFRLDGGSSKLYTQEYVDEKDKEIERLKEEYMILQNASDEVEEEKDKEIERLNKENEKLKKGLNKLLQLNKYMIHFSSKKVISKLIVKQRDLIYELLEGRPRGIMFGSKGVDKE